MLVDLHAHTISSPDGHDTIETMATRADELGIDILGITDHCDAMATRPYLGFFSEDMGCPEFHEDEMRKRFWDARENGKHRVKLLYGIELGEPNLRPQETREVLARNNFDVVLGSVHTFIKDCEPDRIDFAETHPNEVVRYYLRELYDTVKLGGIDVLCHLDYPLRYLPAYPEFAQSLKPFEAEIRAILKLAAQKGIAMELNGKSYRNGKFLLEPFLIDWYREEGGEYLSYGSDSHRAEQLLRSYNEAKAYALAHDMNYFVYFEKRRPHPYRIG